MTFTRPANHRQLTFEEIAKSAKISVNEVVLGLGVPPRGRARSGSTLLSDANPRRNGVSVRGGRAGVRGSHGPPHTGGAAGDEGALGGAREGQHRRGGQARPHDLGAAPRVGPAAGDVAECELPLGLGTGLCAEFAPHGSPSGSRRVR